MRSTYQLSVIAAFVSLVSMQVGAALAKTIFPLVGPEGIAALRIGIAVILLGVVLRPWRLQVERKHWLGLFLYGVTIGAMNLLIYRAFYYIPVGIAISIEVLGPLAVALLASRRKIDLLWIAFALLGLALLPFGKASGGLDLRGVAFTLAAALCWGIYIMVGSKVAIYGSRGVAVGMALASIIILPFGFVHAGMALFQPYVLAFGLVIAVLSGTLPFLLDIYALKSLPRNIFGILMSASPAISAIAGLVILHEQLSIIQWGGIAAITVACFGTTAISARYNSSDR
jgi:Predicted permease, DMT superfamily